jgi:hypothetical protein
MYGMYLARSQDQTNAEHADVQYCTVQYKYAGCRPPPPSSKPVTAGRNHFFLQVYYPPPPYWYRRVM